MNKTIKTLLVIFAAILTLNSCDLTREPYDAIPRENSLESISDAEKWDTGFMTQLRNRVGGFYATQQDYQADYMFASADFGNRGGGWYNWLALTSTDYDVKDIWHSYYVALKNINEFLELSELLVLEDEKEVLKLDTYQGDAHLLRAFYYYQLALRYGTIYNKASADTDLCVPLILKYDIAELPSRATNAQVFDQIAKDIAEAKKLLTSRTNKPMSTVLTVDAAYALEAKVALYKKDWTTALAASEKLISSGTYPLVNPTPDSFKDMWRADKSSEDIVQLYIKKTDEEPRTISYYGYNSSLKANNPDWFPSQTILDLYDDNDLRKDVYFEKAELVKIQSFEIKDLYVISKYKGNPAYDETVPRYIIAPKLFRMGEIYMIAAESAYMLGDAYLSKADKYLNDFRQSRGLEAAEGVSLLEAIKEERTRELAFEGERFWDLRRWGDGMNRMNPQISNDPISENSTETVDTNYLSNMSPFDLKVDMNSYRWIWPIPYNELTTNINIKNQQNPGW